MKSFYFVFIASAFSNFIANIGHQRNCRDPKVLGEMSEIYPKLDDCYPRGPFYSTVATICSNQCSSATAEASYAMTDRCGIPRPFGQNGVFGEPMHVYNTWSNKKANDVVCSKFGNSFCLDEVNRFQTKLTTKQFLNKNTDCNVCLINIHKQFKDDPHSIPQLEITLIQKPVEVLQSIGKLCL